jgi:hypothetical protein
LRCDSRKRCSARIASAARSPMTTHGAIALPVVIRGTIEQSAHKASTQIRHRLGPGLGDHGRSGSNATRQVPAVVIGSVHRGLPFLPSNVSGAMRAPNNEGAEATAGIRRRPPLTRGGHPNMAPRIDRQGIKFGCPFGLTDIVNDRMAS